MALFCGRCGADNPALARYCGDCGNVLEDDSATGSDAAADQPDRTDRPARCVRCGSALRDVRTCERCGTLQPLSEDDPDPWLLWLTFRVPDLIRSPRLAAAKLPYRHRLTGLLPPLAATMLLLPAGWLLAVWPTLLPAWRDTLLPQPPAGGLAALLALLLLLGPCVLLGYGAIIQALMSLLGSAAGLEKTIRALSLVLLPGWIFACGWLCLMRLSQLVLLRLGWLSPDLALAPIAAVYLYALIPVLCAYAALLTIIGALCFQGAFLACVHRIPLTWSLGLHVLGILLALGYIAISRSWLLPRPPLTLMLAVPSCSGGLGC